MSLQMYIHKMCNKDFWQSLKSSLVCWALQYWTYFRERLSWWWKYKLEPQTVRISIYVTYIAVIVAIAGYFTYPEYWTRFTLLVYILVIVAIVFIVVFMIMTIVVCSFSKKLRAWWDGFYHYLEDEETSIRKVTKELQSTLQKLERIEYTLVRMNVNLSKLTKRMDVLENTNATNRSNEKTAKIKRNNKI